MTVKAYIAGPMTGIPNYNFPAFFRASEILRAHGFEVVNPAELDMLDPVMIEVIKNAGPPWGRPDGLTLRDFMKRDIPALLECNAIVLLPGWYNSKGAKLERHVAIECGMDEYFLTGPDVGPTRMRWDEYQLFRLEGTKIAQEWTIALPN